MENVMELIRVSRGATFTRGHIYIAGAFICDSLEDKCRDFNREPKVMHQSAIPEGKYRVALSHSKHFNRVLPHILGVPYFSGILIHPGNTIFDTSGCILVGKSYHDIYLTDSKYHFERLFANILQYNINTIIVR